MFGVTCLIFIWCNICAPGWFGVTLQLKLTATAAQRHHQSFMFHQFKAGLYQKDLNAETRGELGGIRFSLRLVFVKTMSYGFNKECDIRP